MTALELVMQAKQKGLLLALDGEKIRVRGLPKNPEAKAIVEEIRQRKGEVIEVLRSAESSDITEGRIIAVEICSGVLGAHVWFALDENFEPGDGLAVFYGHELEILKNKTPEELRELHRIKLSFGVGTRMRQ
jgi:DNA-directed RNA polymerase subunit H (RpoH/RPB5)